MDWLKEGQQKANYTLDSVDIERAKIVAIIEAKYKQKAIDLKLEQDLKKKRK
jgi:hypothetical protein